MFGLLAVIYVSTAIITVSATSANLSAATSVLIGTNSITSGIPTVSVTATNPATATTDATVTVNMFSNSFILDPTLQSTDHSSNDSRRSNSNRAILITALVVLGIIVFITVIIIALIVIVFWKEKKSRQCNKPEEVYYSTISGANVQKDAKSKPEIVNSEGEAYMDMTKNVFPTITNKVALQDNPSYFIPFDHPHEIEDDLACAYVNIKLQ